MDELIAQFKLLFEQKLKEESKQLGKLSSLSRACEYGLLSGGKRLRPLIVLSFASEKTLPIALEAALSVEFFHTASLIADDLPCMDNDCIRRGKPSVHEAFGETTALLASYALICSAFEKIHQAGTLLKPHCSDKEYAEKTMQALECASVLAGIHGATGGQYFDLFLEKEQGVSLEKLIEMKTVTLFEVSFVFGWLFNLKPISQLPSIRKIAQHFGIAFQIADDFNDIKQDRALSKEKNFVLSYGKEHAISQFYEELKQLNHLLDKLQLGNTIIQGLKEKMVSSFEEETQCVMP